MEPRGYKEDLRKMILDMAHKELENYVSQKGAHKYFEGNIDKVINENIKRTNKGIGVNSVYSRILKSSSYQENISSIAKTIRQEEIFKSKNELVKFARHLGINANMKSSYNQILRKVSSHIYSNRNNYSRKYVSYKRGKDEYILEPDKIKDELIESYRSKTREDMRSIARLLDISVDDEDRAEDIRKKVINYIIKEKIAKKDN
ncbi:hypothetical protein CHL78_000170 [Romboutsia weinsteinii]|uniref:Uncharacterized protein n=1 Tax=Romboutsia weinsteinii TaxID=2020949 RepID=A0A371JA32_9FIRM|nr:hypothetical protein [Romboutsia weinsteinii]RDY29621.1 hypothetical protein CHL78_000170 [Romboutsia weinsteinii]